MKHTNVNLEERLRNLPVTADHTLSDITAGPQLKARIARAAQDAEHSHTRFSLARFLPSACSLALVALVLAIVPGAKQQDPLMHSQPLGPANQPIATAVLTSDLSVSDIRIASGSKAPGYRSIWAPASNGSFPMIGVKGKYYRLLTSPRSVDASLKGSSLGSVEEFTLEPSLSGNDVILSNAAALGTNVYGVRGYGDSLVTAEVDGQMRLFQRVSFNGNALRGKEKLNDTLKVSGHVIAMELSGVGTVTDSAICNHLVDTLFAHASYQNSGSLSSKQALLIELDNGLVVQLAVKGDKLAACGTWSCPEFFEAFEDACD